MNPRTEFGTKLLISNNTKDECENETVDMVNNNGKTFYLNNQNGYLQNLYEKGLKKYYVGSLALWFSFINFVTT